MHVSTHTQRAGWRTKAASVIAVAALTAGLNGLAFAPAVSAGPLAAGTSLAAESTGATITTDQNKYYLGQTMVITGAGFTPGGSVTITVQIPDQTTQTLPVVAADANGAFTTSYTPSPAEPGRYKFTATDGTNSANTASTQADALKTDFLQCANENPTLGLCDWISSILQASDSKYFEGLSTLQRLVFDQIPTTTGNTHTLTFHVDATKGGEHAYDFLSGWDQALAAAQAIDPTETLFPDMSRTTAGNNNACTNPSNPQAALTSVCLALRASSNTDVVDVPIPSQSVADVGGTVTPAQAITNYETYFGSTTGMRLYGASAISGATLTFDGYSSPTGDQFANYTLTWTSASTSLLVEFAAHIAQGIDTLGAGIGYGAGLGAANISGGPYHVSLDLLDGHSLGNQDNQLKGADILVPPETPTVTTQLYNVTTSSNLANGASVEPGTTVHDIVTVAPTTFNGQPTGSVDFRFYSSSSACTSDTTGTGGADAGSFTLSSGAATSNNETSLAPGTYAFRAFYTSDTATKWNNAYSDCEPFTVISPATTLTLKAGYPTPGLTVHTGDTVTVVVTEKNTGDAALTAVSVTGGGMCTSFTGGASTLAAGASTDFTCTFTAADGANAWSATGHGTDPLNVAVPATGEYVEGSVTGINANIQITPATAANPITTNHVLTITVNAIGGTLASGTATASIVSGPGSFVGGVNTCNYTGGGTTATCTVTITSSTAGTTIVSATSDISVGGLTITRTTGTTANTAAGGSGDASKTWQSGHITVIKATKPSGSTQSFPYSTTGGSVTTYDSFNLMDGRQNNQELAPDTYSISEGAVSGWLLTDVSCTSSGSTVVIDTVNSAPTGLVTITLAAGDTVTCTYVNEAPQTTRTQGFWATHMDLTLAVWFGGTVNQITYPGITPPACLAGLTQEQVMGGFWANIAKTSTGDKRSKLGNARMSELQQLLAAILNNAAFGSSPSGMSILDGANIFCTSTNVKDVQNAQSAMASFNTSGDSGIFTPGGSANGNAAKDFATPDGIAYWDFVK